MKELLKNLGFILIFIGVALLTAFFFSQSLNNLWLGGAMGLIIVGLIGYIIINQRVK